VQFVFAQDSLMIKGNEYYKNGSYEAAIDSYTAVIDSGYESATLYYNLGNAYYQSHKLGKAILNYERAGLLNPHDEDIQYNLELAKEKTVDEIESIPEFILVRGYFSFVRFLSIKTWGIISLCFFFIGVLFFIIFFLTAQFRLRKNTFWLGTLTIILSLITFGFAFSHKQYLEHYDKAIIMDASVTAKSTPDDSGKNLFVIHEGTKVTVEDNLDNWKEITLPNGNQGWIKSSSVKMIRIQSQS